MTENQRPTTFECPDHGTVLERGGREGCIPCRNEMAGSLPETGEERASEVLRRLKGPITVSFDHIHERIERLVGRPVWTHEMADADALAEEAATWDHPMNLQKHVVDSMRRIAGPDKPSSSWRRETMPEPPKPRSTPDDLTHYMEAVSRLKSENVRFRAALTRIAAASNDHYLTKDDLRDFMEYAGNEARKALNGVSTNAC